MVKILIATACTSLVVLSCGGDAHETSFGGDAAAIQKAEEMYAAIGGKEAWCALRSLYIRAEHEEPQLPIPYTSEIWRAIDTFDVVIEQRNDSFHVRAQFSAKGGEVRYLDKRDTARVLNAEQMGTWQFENEHNVYVLLHDIACDPSAYSVSIDNEGRLAFYRDSVFATSFELDEQKRPYMFFKPNFDGSVSGSIFTHWATDGGLVHSAGGHPLDSNFIYRTESWQPSNEPLREAFGDGLPAFD